MENFKDIQGLLADKAKVKAKEEWFDAMVEVNNIVKRVTHGLSEEELTEFKKSAISLYGEKSHNGYAYVPANMCHYPPKGFIDSVIQRESIDFLAEVDALKGQVKMLEEEIGRLLERGCGENL